MPRVLFYYTDTKILMTISYHFRSFAMLMLESVWRFVIPFPDVSDLKKNIYMVHIWLGVDACSRACAKDRKRHVILSSILLFGNIFPIHTFRQWMPVLLRATPRQFLPISLFPSWKHFGLSIIVEILPEIRRREHLNRQKLLVPHGILDGKSSTWWCVCEPWTFFYS